jgi:DNA-binding MarR family transcriptional regulator
MEIRINQLRQSSRKLVRELGMLQLNQAKHGKTPQHWHVLMEIAKEPRITISKLGHLLLLSISATSRVVESLIKHGMVESKDGIDKREKQLTITDKGQLEIHSIDDFSNAKIIGAFEFLTIEEQEEIMRAIQKYAEALEKSRLLREQVKIRTMSTSRTLRKQIISMIENIQVNEFSVPILSGMNNGIFKAEGEYYYNNAYNFWYATDDEGAIIGSVGLKRLNESSGEIKKFFVAQKYRGKGVAQKLMVMLLKA